MYKGKAYEKIFNILEKGKDFVEKIGKTGFSGGEQYWKQAIKHIKVPKKPGHMNGYGLDVSLGTDMDKVEKTANEFGLTVLHTKKESDHLHLSLGRIK